MRCRRGKLDQNCKVRFFSPMTTAASLIGEMYNGMEKKKILQVFILPVRRYRLCRQIERGREIFGAGSSLQLLSSSCVFDGRLRRRQRRGWAAGQGKHQFRSLLYPHMHPLGYIHPISSIISPLRMSRREMKARGTRRRGGKKNTIARAVCAADVFQWMPSPLLLQTQKNEGNALSGGKLNV